MWCSIPRRASPPRWRCRAPDVPSALFEADFITNPGSKRLSSAEDQARFAEAMERAIRVFFAHIPARPLSPRRNRQPNNGFHLASPEAAACWARTVMSDTAPSARNRFA